MKNFEQELKLALTADEYDKLINQFDLKGVIQTNHYFYCDGMALDKLLRLREKQGNYQLTLKVQLEHTNDVMQAEEYNADVSVALASALIECGINGVQLQSLLGEELPRQFCGADVNFRYLGKLVTLRSVWTTEDGLIVELDKNDYLGACDYELECESTDIAKILALKDKLKSLGITIKSSCAKSKRFFEKLASIPMPLLG